ncbi:MAG TPA: dTDP-4-dehydrorhamnose reductase [Phycicoccus sp.]|nr:dTDP-4-dehydrorhamnose reductase [Phycicoccus sp.]
MRWLVAGAHGMLGQDLCAVLEAAGHEVTPADLPGLNILAPEQCREQVAGHDIVANCAAYTAVDAAEAQEGTAFAVNAVGAANLARAAADTGAAMVQISTDYVFAGDATTPYAEDAPLAPVSAYGRTKAAGEWAVRSLCPRSWVVRTAWLYGAAGPTGFPKAMQRLAAARDTLTVVSDQVGQPTWTWDLAHGVRRLVEAAAPFGRWHGTGSGQCSWFDLARATFEELGLDPARVSPITSAEYAAMYPAAAARPAYSVLGHDRWQQAGIEPLPHWRDALHRAAPTVLRAQSSVI